MNFNTIFYRLGIDPECFVNEEKEPIVSGSTFIYEARQRTDKRTCPHCGNLKTLVKDHDVIEINCSETDQRKDILHIRKTRFFCPKCQKTFTLPINGIQPYSKTGTQVTSMILNDFMKPITFSDIAKRYDLSSARVIQVFDEKIKYVPRLEFGEILCIDEIRFHEDQDQKYCCVLYDYRKKKIVDIVRNRQLPYLNEYFSAIPQKEKDRVKYFVSDMYDGYKTVYRKYFRKAIHIVDLFHVISQLTRALNRMRVKAMNSEEDQICRNFMKAHWKEFLCRTERISNRTYTSLKSGNSIPYCDLVYECLLHDPVLLEIYNCLQDLYRYEEYDTFNEALSFIDHISERLALTGNESAEAVGRTYHKWRAEIANALASNQNNIHYSNAIAESLNNQLKSIIKAAYGYHSFDRFRKRAMMIITYKNGV